MSTAYGTATLSQLSEEDRTMYELALLPRAVPPFSHLWIGQQGYSPGIKIPENSGQTVN